MTSTTGRSSDGIGRPHAAAFTLLELVLVMVIACTALAMVAPSLRGFWTGARARDAALQLVAITRWARSQAVAGVHVIVLRFDARGGTYRLEESSATGSAPVLTEFGRTFTLPEGMQVDIAGRPGMESNCIRFYPDGRSDGGRIRLQGLGPDVFEVVAPSPGEPFELRGDGEERNNS